MTAGATKIITTFIILLLLGYLATLTFLYVMQRRLTYFPPPEFPVALTYTMQEMEIIHPETEDGIRLKAWYKAPTDPEKPVIIMFHGNVGHIGIRCYKARPFLKKGYGYLLAEYRGYGGLAGKPSEDGFYKDGRAYLNWLIKEQSIPAGKIILYGESLGTGVAVQMGTEYEGIKGIILETPYTKLPDVGQTRFPLVPVGLLMKDKYANINKVGSLKMLILILHGKRDIVVPYKQGEKLFNAAAEPKTFESFPKGGHNDLYFHGAVDKINAFLESL